MNGHDNRRPGDLVREFRSRAGLTQQQTAARAGISIGGLRDLEQGRVALPRASTLRALAAGLELSQAETDRLVQATQVLPDLHIEALGSLRVTVQGVTIELSSTAQLTILGRLALSANSPVHRDLLIDIVWGEQSPAAATELLQTYISRLRQRLGGRPDLISATHGGYRLNVSVDQLDILGFQQALSAARQARSAGDATVSCNRYQAASEYWRDIPLANVPKLRTTSLAGSLSHDWRTALLEYADVAAESGVDDKVIPLLEQLIAAEPMHEAAYERLMTALTNVGQRAAAIERFDRLRRRLADEVGADPGPAVRRAFERLRQLGEQRSGSPVVNVYGELPPDNAHFTGRTADLAHLGNLVSTISPASTAITICTINGMAGVGKTSLAVHFAHQLVRSRQYTDVQLYVDLHGYADTQPAEPGEVLASLLAQLGVLPAQIPSEIDARTAMYREKLIGKDAIVMLDNAAGEAQVEPLLPADPRNLVFVTSRHTIALDGSHIVNLDGISDADAGALISRIAGDRHRSDATGFRRLIRRCARLPLAVVLAAEHLRAHTTLTPTNVADELDRGAQSIVEAATSFQGLARVFDLSYRALDPDAQQLFRLLPVHPGADFTAESAAAVIGDIAEHANDLLDSLANRHLINPVTSHRYQQHALLREFASAIAARYADESDAASHRLYLWYLYTADSACRALFTRLQASAPDRELASAYRPANALHFETDLDAVHWLADEEATLLAIGPKALGSGQHEIAWQIPIVLMNYFDHTQNWRPWIAAAELGLDAARRAGESTPQATSLRLLGRAYGDIQDPDRALAYSAEALELSQNIGNKHSEFHALNIVAIAHMVRGELDDAVVQYRQALRLADNLGDEHLADIVLSNLGIAYTNLNDTEEAINVLQRVVETRRGFGDQPELATALHSLGKALTSAERYEAGIVRLQESIEIRRRLHATGRLASTLDDLGYALLNSGQLDRAQECFDEALTLMEEMGHPSVTDVRRHRADLDRARTKAR